jgi:hypothetical protein
MTVRSIRFPEDLDAKIVDVSESQNESINSVVIEACRIGLSLPRKPELEDRFENLEQRVEAIETKLNDLLNAL